MKKLLTTLCLIMAVSAAALAQSKFKHKVHRSDYHGQMKKENKKAKAAESRTKAKSNLSQKRFLDRYFMVDMRAVYITRLDYRKEDILN